MGMIEDARQLLDLAARNPGLATLAMLAAVVFGAY